jgi:hypothetical protein
MHLDMNGHGCKLDLVLNEHCNGIFRCYKVPSKSHRRTMFLVDYHHRN